MQKRYPRLIVNLSKIESNAKTVLKDCNAAGITVAGIMKGASALPEVVKTMADSGVAQIGSSRMEQLIAAHNLGVKQPLMLVRVPMLSEAEEVVKYVDISLQSDINVLRRFNEEALKQNKIHKVFIMMDLGDLREGFWDWEEATAAAVEVETKLRGLYLLGVAVNLGCYGSIVPTPEKEQELVDLAAKVEAAIGRKLDYVSGGASTSYMRVLDGNMPKGINHLRIGEQIILAHDAPVYWGYDTPQFHRDTFRIQAEVIEVRDKPSFPVGERFVDAFGNAVQYEDRGIRRRMLIALGKCDYGAYPEELDVLPEDEGIEILGASSDHTIIDIQDAKREYHVGDIIEFGLKYSTNVYLTNSPNVHVEYVRD